MDTDLLKTFLEVSRTRHFARAAENLYLTPSAVSARVRLLESQLGVTLFDRQRNNIGLTAAGERLLQQAGHVLRAWERARQQVALGEQQQQPLLISATPGLWEGLALEWTQRLWADCPQLALRLESAASHHISDALERGLIDIGLLLDPLNLPGLNARQLGEIRLQLYAHQAGNAQQALAERYIMVDWGPAFASRHADWFPEAPPPHAQVSTARLAIALLRGSQGAAYLADSMFGAELKEAGLNPVADAPRIKLPVYAIYRDDSPQRDSIEDALQRFSQD